MSQIALLYSLNLLVEHKYCAKDLHYTCRIIVLFIIAMQYII